MTRDDICKHKHMEMLRYRSQESLVSIACWPFGDLESH